MNNRIFFLLIVFSSMVVLTSCTDDNNQNLDNPLVGLWIVDIPADDDFSYQATWRFSKDESYQLDFSSGYIGGGAQGYSSGTYNLISDSILVVHSTNHENLVHNYAFSKEQDTLFVEVADSRLITSGVRLVGQSQYERYGTILIWEK
ncbi:MAG: hypothetical protein JSU77_05670 [Fidelibacterota bacterium]|nr:MAG: hypothetical protein JSU77_05670 [Candidatus Neomarinimicrobiota bacterium]